MKFSRILVGIVSAMRMVFFYVVGGIVGLIIVLYLFDGRDYYPDQWFKKNIVAQDSLSVAEKDAVNKLFNDVRNQAKNWNHIVNKPDVKKVSPVLKRKFSRKSLRQFMENVYVAAQADQASSPKFIRKDFFLEYSPEIEFIDWGVYDLGKATTKGPRYVIKGNFRNLTNCFIKRIAIGLESRKQKSVVVDGSKVVQPEYASEFTLFPVSLFQPEYFQQFICAVDYDTYMYIRSIESYAIIKLVEIDELP